MWRRRQHERAAADTCADQAFRGKLAVAGDNRVAVDAEQLGQFARARQRVAGLQPSAADIVRDCAGELQEQRLLALRIQGNAQFPMTHESISRLRMQSMT